MHRLMCITDFHSSPVREKDRERERERDKKRAHSSLFLKMLCGVDSVIHIKEHGLP